MSQSRNRRRIATKNLQEPDKLALAIKQVQVIAEGLTLAHSGVMSVIQDVTQLRAVVSEVARRVGMTDEEIDAITSGDAEKDREQS